MGVTVLNRIKSGVGVEPVVREGEECEKEGRNNVDGMQNCCAFSGRWIIIVTGRSGYPMRTIKIMSIIIVGIESDNDEQVFGESLN